MNYEKSFSYSQSLLTELLLDTEHIFNKLNFNLEKKKTNNPAAFLAAHPHWNQCYYFTSQSPEDPTKPHPCTLYLVKGYATSLTDMETC